MRNILVAILIGLFMGVILIICLGAGIAFETYGMP
mgnify:CR=1 FL=1